MMLVFCHSADRKLSETTNFLTVLLSVARVAADEFHCAPVTQAVPGGTKYDLPIRALARRGELAYVADLARDGSEVLFDVGPFDGPAGHRVYAIPFECGKPRLLVSDATDASWAR
jgi:hypothetical protein